MGGVAAQLIITTVKNHLTIYKLVAVEFIDQPMG
jgi:hypothetical protein